MLNQANTVVAKRDELNFWRNVIELSMLREPVHYHDAKTKSCLTTNLLKWNLPKLLKCEQYQQGLLLLIDGFGAQDL